LNNDRHPEVRARSHWLCASLEGYGPDRDKTRAVALRGSGACNCLRRSHLRVTVVVSHTLRESIHAEMLAEIGAAQLGRGRDHGDAAAVEDAASK